MRVGSIGALIDNLIVVDCRVHKVSIEVPGERLGGLRGGAGEAEQLMQVRGMGGADGWIRQGIEGVACRGRLERLEAWQ